MPGELFIDDVGAGVRVLTLSNPQRRNAIDGEMLTRLDAAIAGAHEARALLIRGAGDALFSAGWDLNDLTTYEAGERLPDDRLGDVFDRLEALPIPTVAVLDGPAFGAACELAMACDFRVGGPKTVLSMPPARLGVVYALRGLERFRRKLGDGTTRWLVLTGRRLDAHDALRRGALDLLSQTPRSDAEALCRTLAGNAPLAMAGLKAGLSLLGRSPTDAELASYEALRRRSFNSEDAAEGRAAILEKREPVFSGR